jgi:hypothetical protein
MLSFSRRPYRGHSMVGRIFDRLTSRYGRDAVFRDIDNIPGLDFREQIRASIDDSDVLLVVVGPRWMGDDRHGQPRTRAEEKERNLSPQSKRNNSQNTRTAPPYETMTVREITPSGQDSAGCRHILVMPIAASIPGITDTLRAIRAHI